MRRAREGALGLALLSLLAFLVLEAIVVRETLSGFDAHIAGLSRGQNELRSAMQTVSLLGSGYTLIPLTILTSLLLWRRRRRLAVLLPGMVTVAIVVNGAIKWVVARPRPRGTSYAFPSGHVLFAVVVFGVLIHLLWTSPVRPLGRVVGTALCVMVVCAVALSRVYLNLHWVTDVAGGLMGGTVFLLLGLAWAEIGRTAPPGGET